MLESGQVYWKKKEDFEFKLLAMSDEI